MQASAPVSTMLPEEQRLWVELLRTILYDNKSEFSFDNSVNYSAHGVATDRPPRGCIDISSVVKYPIFVSYCTACSGRTEHSISCGYIHKFCSCDMWQLPRLPDEIWCKIFEYMHPLEVMRNLPTVSKHMYSLTGHVSGIYWKCFHQSLNAKQFWYEHGLARAFTQEIQHRRSSHNVQNSFPLFMLLKVMKLRCGMRRYDQFLQQYRDFCTNELWLLPPVSKIKKRKEDILDLRLRATANYILEKLGVIEYMKAVYEDELWDASVLLRAFSLALQSKETLMKDVQRQRQEIVHARQARRQKRQHPKTLYDNGQSKKRMKLLSSISREIHERFRQSNCIRNSLTLNLVQTFIELMNHDRISEMMMPRKQRLCLATLMPFTYSKLESCKIEVRDNDRIRQHLMNNSQALTRSYGIVAVETDIAVGNLMLKRMYP